MYLGTQCPLHPDRLTWWRHCITDGHVHLGSYVDYLPRTGRRAPSPGGNQDRNPNRITEPTKSPPLMAVVGRTSPTTATAKMHLPTSTQTNQQAHNPPQDPTFPLPIQNDNHLLQIFQDDNHDTKHPTPPLTLSQKKPLLPNTPRILWARLPPHPQRFPGLNMNNVFQRDQNEGGKRKVPTKRDLTR